MIFRGKTELDGRVLIELQHKYVLMSLILMYISHLERNEVIKDTVLLVITKMEISNLINKDL